MVDSFPERATLRSVLLDAAAAGVALGAFSLGGGSLVLYESSGLLVATAGLIASLVVALLVGLWVSAPAAELEEPPVRERWLVAALAVGTAGVYASFLQMNDSLATGVAGRVGALLLLVGIPAYTLGMALPVLLAWGQRSQEAATGEVADLSVTGALVAGLLGGVAVGAVATGYLLLEGVGPGPVLLGTAVLLLAPMLLHRPAESDSREELIFETDTAFHALRVTEVVYPGDRQPERRLYLNGEEESGELVRSGAPTLAYVAAAEAWLAEQTPRGASYLFLGGGAYTLPRRVAERDSRAAITVVELDSEVTRAAYRFFGLRPEHGIRSVHGDARAFLSRANDAEFDRIYADVYGGQESLPYSLVTQEALEAMRDRLRTDGIASINVIGTTHGPESTRFWSVVRTFASVFRSVALYTHLGRDYPDRQNLMLAGSTSPVQTFAPRAGLFEPWPRDEWPAVAGAVVFRDLFGPRAAGGAETASPFALAKGEE
jgi:hypothetical protein